MDMEVITISQEEYGKLIYKANKWDRLDHAIGRFYETYDDDGNEIPPERSGDLGDIGEVAASITGWL